MHYVSCCAAIQQISDCVRSTSVGHAHSNLRTFKGTLLLCQASSSKDSNIFVRVPRQAHLSQNSSRLPSQARKPKQPLPAGILVINQRQAISHESLHRVVNAQCLPSQSLHPNSHLSSISGAWRRLCGGPTFEQMQGAGIR